MKSRGTDDELVQVVAHGVQQGNRAACVANGLLHEVDVALRGLLLRASNSLDVHQTCELVSTHDTVRMSMI